MPPSTETPEIEVTSRAELREWLAANHTRTTGVWLVTFRKAEGMNHVPYAAVVQECLCFGWVDSLPRKKDDARTMLWIAPRRPGSNWSRINKAHVATLQATGLMTAAGQAAIDRAMADRTWTALDDVEDGILPPDLLAALDSAPGMQAVWDAYPPSVRRGALEVLLNARRPATRAARIAVILENAQRGERPFQWRKPQAKPVSDPGSAADQPMPRADRAEE